MSICQEVKTFGNNSVTLPSAGGIWHYSPAQWRTYFNVNKLWLCLFLLHYALSPKKQKCLRFCSVISFVQPRPTLSLPTSFITQIDNCCIYGRALWGKKGFHLSSVLSKSFRNGRFTTNVCQSSRPCDCYLQRLWCKVPEVHQRLASSGVQEWNNSTFQSSRPVVSRCLDTLHISGTVLVRANFSIQNPIHCCSVKTIFLLCLCILSRCL